MTWKAVLLSYAKVPTNGTFLWSCRWTSLYTVIEVKGVLSRSERKWGCSESPLVLSPRCQLGDHKACYGVNTVLEQHWHLISWSACAIEPDMSKTAFYSSKPHSLEGLRTGITQQQAENVLSGVDSWPMVIMSKLSHVGCVDLKL